MWGFHAGTSITAHVQHLFTSLRQTFTPPACPVGRLLGRQGGSHQVCTKTPSVQECSDVLENSLLLAAHSASSFATTVLPSKWRGVLQGKGDCRRKYAGTAYGSCCLQPSMVFLYFSAGLLLPQPSVVSTNLKGTAWEPRRHVDKDFSRRG